MAKVTHSENTNIVGYILAGGESRRFDYEIKGLKLLHDKPMIQYVIDRFKPQVGCLNINSHFIEFSQLGFPTVGEIDTFQGPLSGLFSCFKHMSDYYPCAEWLAIAPCDAPFIPKDMIQLLTEKTTHTKNSIDYQAQCFLYENHLQPTFSIWHKDLMNDLETAINVHQWGGLKIFLESLGDVVNIVEYPQQHINPFFNVNSEQDRLQAERLLKTSV